MKNKRIYLAQQAARAMQLLAGSLDLTEAEQMEIADLYEPWVQGKNYPVGKILKYGVNQDNETQLYTVQQAHTSQTDWTPDKTPALFKSIGFTADNTPIWTQPLGAHDAYNINDIVSHKGKKWKNTMNANAYEPGVYGWIEL